MLRAPKSIVVTCSFSFALLPTALRMPVATYASQGNPLTHGEPQEPHPEIMQGFNFQPERSTRASLSCDDGPLHASSCSSRHGSLQVRLMPCVLC